MAATQLNYLDMSNSPDTPSKNILHADVEIRGSIRCSGELAFDGKIDGDISTESNLTLGEGAVVKGNITAANVIVRGKVNGNIRAKDKIEIKSRTELTGDITGARLVIEDGVAFIGNAQINPIKTAPATSPHAPRVADAYKAAESSRASR